TPPAAKQSLESLATYLGSAASTDLEKIRAVYKWVTANISYDIDGYFGKKEKSPNDPQSVLKNGTSVCEGYASISLSLLQLLGIECVKISGYSKGFGYNPTKPLTTDKDTDHAWNAVKLNGEWRFIETTWGAGHVNSDHKFERNETDFYFLTDPEVFIEAHFPYMNSDMAESKKWQLLKNPIDLDTFNNRVKREKACIEHQVELMSHNKALVDVDGEVTLKFRGNGKPLTSFSAKFVNPSTGERLSSDKYVATVLDHHKNEVTVTARPPSSGVYWKLDVFGKTNEAAKTSDCIVSYHLQSKSDRHLPEFPDDSLGYYGLHESPEKFGFSKHNFCSKEGFWLQVDGGAQSEFQLKIPASTLLSASAEFLSADKSAREESFSFVEYNEGFLKVSLRMGHAGFYQLQLFCKESGSKSNSLPMLANLLVECVKPMKQPKPFPTSYTSVIEEQVTLVCPRDGNLPANSEIRFKLSSPRLKKLMVNKKVYDATKDGFDIVEKTGSVGSDLSVFGTADANAASFTGLYRFKII
uniref:TGc domain-containing protein n=1 Tax=Macrostomum lignano TaxID=282301 RepID=A0A1I8G3T2_9PLAT